MHFMIHGYFSVILVQFMETDGILSIRAIIKFVTFHDNIFIICCQRNTESEKLAFK